MDAQRLDELERYTISGNSVPVDRVTLPAQDLRDLIAEVRNLQNSLAFAMEHWNVAMDEWAKQYFETCDVRRESLDTKSR